MLLQHYLESGDVYVPDSNRFRSFEDDLIDNESWKNKESLIQQLGLAFLSKPIEEILSELNKELETLLIEVNQRIEEGTNRSIKITENHQDSKWSLPYNKTEDSANHPLFDQLPQIEIRDLLSFVNSQTAFMSAFTHILSHHLKNADEDEAITGSLIALATNKGLSKMAQSSDLTYQSLFSAMKNYLRLETIKNANNKISNSTLLLPIFQYFNVEENLIHSSSDGQKFETQINTINARYSPKYFGLNKGIVSYTMVANNVPVNAKIIGANEHESHFVFDIVHNNTSDIQPDRHSVDSHGTNNVNFLILHVFGYQFAPRYKDISSKSETLYCFNNPNLYTDLLRCWGAMEQKTRLRESGNIRCRIFKRSQGTQLTTLD
ncbi:MAG: Tn3 family transposase [Acidobacteriota bacterium]